MPQTSMPQTGRNLNAALWVLQIIAAAAFLAAGGAKLAGAQQMVDVFEKLGVGQWFRYVTGSLEIIGAIAILTPRLAFYGAALLSTVMIGAVVSHQAILGGSPVPAIVLLLIAGTVTYFRRPASLKSAAI